MLRRAACCPGRQPFLSPPHRTCSYRFRTARPVVDPSFDPRGCGLCDTARPRALHMYIIQITPCATPPASVDRPHPIAITCSARAAAAYPARIREPWLPPPSTIKDLSWNFTYPLPRARTHCLHLSDGATGKNGDFHGIQIKEKEIVLIDVHIQIIDKRSRTHSENYTDISPSPRGVFLGLLFIFMKIFLIF